MTPEERREALLVALLPHVAFDGWGRQALLGAAEDLDIEPALALNAFPGGAQEMIEAFSAWADQKTLKALDKEDLESMKVRERIALGVRTRLMVLEPHKEAVRRGLSYLAFPSQAGGGLKCLYRTVDALWYAAGDRATDYNFYTKRLLLAGVLSSTLLYWLNDSSEDYEATWAFLDRRIDNVLKVGGRLGKTVGKVLDLPDRLTAGLLRRRPSRPGSLNR